MVEQIRTGSVRRCLTLSIVLAGAVVSCSSSNDATSGQTGLDGGEVGDAVISCAHDPRVEVFSEGLTHKGDAGNLSFVIVGSTFDPPAVANNTWTLKVLDASGQAMKGAVLTFPKGQHPGDPWMPDHSHGALPAKAVNNNDGTYNVSPLYFFMGGVWSLYVSATAGSVTDTTTFTFCVGS